MCLRLHLCIPFQFEQDFRPGPTDPTDPSIHPSSNLSIHRSIGRSIHQSINPTAQRHGDGDAVATWIHIYVSNNSTITNNYTHGDAKFSLTQL